MARHRKPTRAALLRAAALHRARLAAVASLLALACARIALVGPENR
jgi:hypothetical protein